MPRCLLGLGANLGDRQQQLDRALELLARSSSIVAVSQYLATTPVGGPDHQDTFLNAAAVLETNLSPLELWQSFRQIESSLGRQRGVRWEARSIDLDLLLYDDLVWQSPELTLPHPWMIARRFVLQPASEIASDWVHPLLNWTVGQLWNHAQQTLPRFALAGSIDRSLGPAICQQASAQWIPAWTSIRPHNDSFTALTEAETLLRDAGWNRNDPNSMLADVWWQDLLLENPEIASRPFQSSLGVPKLVFIGAERPSESDSQESQDELPHSARLLQLLVDERQTIGVIVQATQTSDVVREIAGAMKAMEST